MRVVISEDKDAKALMAQLELARIEWSGNCIPCGGNEIDDAHRVFNYIVVGWLQEQGFQLR